MDRGNKRQRRTTTPEELVDVLGEYLTSAKNVQDDRVRQVEIKLQDLRKQDAKDLKAAQEAQKQSVRDLQAAKEAQKQSSRAISDLQAAWLTATEQVRDLKAQVQHWRVAHDASQASPCCCGSSELGV